MTRHKVFGAFVAIAWVLTAACSGEDGGNPTHTCQAIADGHFNVPTDGGHDAGHPDGGQIAGGSGT